jgi:hypothetical protein
VFVEWRWWSFAHRHNPPQLINFGAAVAVRPQNGNFFDLKKSINHRKNLRDEYANAYMVAPNADQDGLA